MVNELVEIVSELQRRVRVLEDHIALYQSLGAYGPAVDSMELRTAVDGWEPDGVYDLGDGFPDIDGGRGLLVLQGHAEILRMLESPVHGDFVDQGCAHVMSLPLVRIDGDRAVGIGYHRVYAHGENGAYVGKLSASRIEWRRQDSGEWKIVRRTHRLIDGREQGRNLLRDSLREILESDEAPG